MKIIPLILLFAFPTFSQCVEDTGRLGIKSLNPFHRSFNDAKAVCNGDDLIITMRLTGRSDLGFTMKAIEAKLRETLAGRVSSVIVEASYWDITGSDPYYSIAPTHVVTTRTKGTAYSTITGGNVVEHPRYSHTNRMARMVINF